MLRPRGLSPWTPTGTLTGPLTPLAKLALPLSISPPCRFCPKRFLLSSIFPSPTYNPGAAGSHLLIVVSVSASRVPCTEICTRDFSIALLLQRCLLMNVVVILLLSDVTAHVHGGKTLTKNHTLYCWLYVWVNYTMGGKPSVPNDRLPADRTFIITGSNKGLLFFNSINIPWNYTKWKKITHKERPKIEKKTKKTRNPSIIKMPR